MKDQHIWNKNFILICLGVFFLFSNFYILLSTMPLALQKNMDATAQIMSLVVSIYSMGIVVLRPFSGLVADKYGKKKVTVITFLLFSLCSVAYLGIDSIIPLLAIRLFHGVFHSMSTTSHAAMAIDMIPAGKKGEGIGYYGLAMSLAMVVAPALGIYMLEHHSYEALLYVGAGFALAGWALTLFVDTDEQTRDKRAVKIGLSTFVELKAVPIGLSAFLISFCYSSIISYIALYAKELQLTDAAMYFYIAFASSIILTRPFVGKLIDRKGPGYLVYPSLVVFGMGILILGFSNHLIPILISSIILGASYGAIFPSFQTIAVKESPAHRTGASMATFFLFYDLGFGLGAFVLGSVVSHSGYSTMYTFVSLIVMATIVTYYLMNERKARPVAQTL
jgi:predicted MFS family arabinose efflux permease